MLDKLTRKTQRPTTLSLDQAQMIISTNQNWLVNMESLVDAVDELDHLESTLESLDEAGALNHGVGILVMERIQTLENLTGRIVDTVPSLESDSYTAEGFKDTVLPALVKVGELTSKAYSDNFDSILSALSNVSLGSIHTAKTSIKKSKVLRDKLKGADVSGKVTVSLSGKNIGNAFTLDGRPVGELVGALKKDLVNVKLLMEIVPQQVIDFALNFDKIVTAGDYSSDEAFVNTVMSKLTTLEHPTVSMAKKIKVDTELLFNTTLSLVEKPSPKARGIDTKYVHLANLATKSLVKERGGKPSQRNDSIQLSKVDLENLLECSEVYSEAVINGWGTYRKMSSALKRVMKAVRQLDSKDIYLGSNNVKAVKQIIAISKHIPQYYRNPLSDETDRCIKMALATRVLVSRAIKSNKPA